MSEQVDIAVDLGVVPPPLPEILTLRQMVKTALKPGAAIRVKRGSCMITLITFLGVLPILIIRFSLSPLLSTNHSPAMLRVKEVIEVINVISGMHGGLA